MKNKTKIFLVDDHTILREGLKLIIEDVENYCVVGESGDGKEALDLIEKLEPDISILDISLPGMSGIDIVRHLKKYQLATKIIILSRHDNDEYIKQLLKLGVDGYVLKDDAGEDLLRAVEAVLNGDKYLSPRVASQVVSEYISLDGMIGKPGESQFDLLTGREREVLKLLAEGMTGQEAADCLRISARTIKAHRANIMKKLDIHKTSELILYAVKNHIVEV